MAISLQAVSLPWFKAVTISLCAPRCRVLPWAGSDRFCFTVWLSASRPTAPRSPPPPPGLGGSAGPSPDAAWACLLHPSLRKHAARYALRDEWARSLEESHPPSAERDALLSNFWREIGVIERVVKPLFDATAGQPPPRQLTHSAWL